MSWTSVGLHLIVVFCNLEILAATSTSIPSAETVVYVEEWRTADEETAPYVLGTVSCIRSGEGGQVYVLDSQQTLLHRFAPDGQYDGLLAQRGEGPGGLSGGYPFFVWPGDRLAIPRRGGSVMLLEGDGRYLESIPLDAGPSGSFGTARSAWSAGERVLVWVTRSGGEQSSGIRESVLALFEPSGKLAHELIASPVPVRGHASGTVTFRERDSFFAGSRHVAGGDGLVYIAPDRDLFYIEVRDDEGQLKAEIRAPIEAVVRTPDQVEAVKRTFGVGGTPGAKLPEVDYVIDPLEPPIRRLHWVHGTLWVELAVAEAAPGSIGRFAIFDADGELGSIRDLVVPHDSERDRWHLLSDGRVAIVENYAGAMKARFTGTNMQVGGKVLEGTAEDFEGVSVVIYRPES